MAAAAGGEGQGKDGLSCSETLSPFFSTQLNEHTWGTYAIMRPRARLGGTHDNETGSSPPEGGEDRCLHQQHELEENDECFIRGLGDINFD